MTQGQRCLIVAVDLDRHVESIIRRAANVARFGNLPLMVVHVVEHDCGFETDHIPFRTPDELRATMAREARAWLLGVVHHLGLPDTEVVTRSGNLPDVLADLAVARRARYVVTGSPAWGALSRLASLANDSRLAAIRCDLLHMGNDKANPGQRLASWAGRWLSGSDARPGER